MIRWQTYLLCAGLTLALTVGADAGPSTQQIDSTVARVNARLGQDAAAGPTARESMAAQLHHQPTPLSMAEAEKAGGLSQGTINAVKSAMTRAREADSRGDAAGCERALKDVDSILGQQ
jgi:hypothetical protein